MAAVIETTWYWRLLFLYKAVGANSNILQVQTSCSDMLSKKIQKIYIPFPGELA